ncbi:jg3647 [Pararge aegeria aegeria]|uniref:Jg3647 protein n=1 Tax=Pararge aegeria aegeria TaxID=348720 RepID=A0A8S4RG95_9NEOP|nr:jg3647 [Pararge aegeria aegeria]
MDIIVPWIRWTLSLKVLEWRPRTGKRSVGGKITSGESLGAAGDKRPRTVYFVELPTKDICPAVDVDWLT